jgi:hypothetical protein
MIGKWHLKSEPTGFDHWKILKGQGEYYNPLIRDESGERNINGYVTDIITNLAIETLEKQRLETNLCYAAPSQSSSQKLDAKSQVSGLFQRQKIPSSGYVL